MPVETNARVSSAGGVTMSAMVSPVLAYIVVGYAPAQHLAHRPRGR